MTQPIPPEMKNDPTYRKYVLNCRIKFFRKTVTEDIGGGKVQNYERKMVLLIPQESDECYRFYGAWVPATVEQYFELAAVVGSPVNSPARLSVHRGQDSRSEKPYLFVMTKAVEDFMVNMREGDVVRVTTLAANQDEEADNVETSNGNYDPLNQG